MRKVHRQPVYSVTNPPMMGPSTCHPGVSINGPAFRIDSSLQVPVEVPQ